MGVAWLLFRVVLLGGSSCSLIMSSILFTDKHRQENRAVLVFDNLGISRAAAIVMAYLMKYNGGPKPLAVSLQRFCYYLNSMLQEDRCH